MTIVCTADGNDLRYLMLSLNDVTSYITVFILETVQVNVLSKIYCKFKLLHL
jgi:hypothetical protein